MFAKMILILVLLTGLVFFAVGAFRAFATYRWLSTAGIVEGTVVSLTWDGRDNGGNVKYVPVVGYRFKGTRREFKGAESSPVPPFSIGQVIKVAVSEDGNNAALATFGRLYGKKLFLMLPGAALIAMALIFLTGDRLLKLIHPNLI